MNVIEPEIVDRHDSDAGWFGMTRYVLYWNDGQWNVVENNGQRDRMFDVLCCVCMGRGMMLYVMRVVTEIVNEARRLRRWLYMRRENIAMIDKVAADDV